jgi:hypothetical protein
MIPAVFERSWNAQASVLARSRDALRENGGEVLASAPSPESARHEGVPAGAVIGERNSRRIRSRTIEWGRRSSWDG